MTLRWPPKILYALGPGNVVAMYRQLLEGTEPAFEMSIAFSRLFFDWCRENRAPAHAISWCANADSIRDRLFEVENRPKLSWYYAGGVRHHLAGGLYGLKIIWQVLRDRAAVAVIDSGTSHWILFSLLAIARIPVIAVIHSTLWPMGLPPRRRQDRLLRALDGIFFRHFAAATICVSPECERQIKLVAGKTAGPVYQCRAQFRRGFFDAVPPPDTSAMKPFRILFVGRIETNKGVFLLAELAELLEHRMPGQCNWKLIGGGSALPALQARLAERGLTGIVKATGRLPRAEVLQAHGWAHANIVPTMADYSEGLAMTAAEAILAGRPVVVSQVVPAWEILGSAAVVAETGNVESFANALSGLALDRTFYRSCQAATKGVQEQFYRESSGLGAVIGQAITAIRPRAGPEKY